MPFIALLLAPLLAVTPHGNRQFETHAQTLRAKPTNKVSRSVSHREANVIDDLRRLLTPLGVQVEAAPLLKRASLSQELRLRWTPTEVNAASEKKENLTRDLQAMDARPLTLVERRTHEQEAKLPRLRAVELSTNQVFVAAIDNRGLLRWWTLIADPRIVRAERPDANGLLSGEVLYDPQAEILLTLPADAEIAEVRLYKPRWDGARFALQSVGVVAVEPAVLNESR